jgi:hypothetical protein
VNTRLLISGSHDCSTLIGQDSIGDSVRLTLERIFGFAERNLPMATICSKQTLEGQIPGRLVDVSQGRNVIPLVRRLGMRSIRADSFRSLLEEDGGSAAHQSPSCADGSHY